MMIVILGFLIREYCHTLCDYDKRQNKIKFSETGEHVLHEPEVCETLEFGADKSMMNKFVLTRDESPGEKEV